MNRVILYTAGDYRMTQLQPGGSGAPRGFQIRPVAQVTRTERNTATPCHPALKLLFGLGFLAPLLFAACAIAIIPSLEAARHDRAQLDVDNVRAAAAQFERRQHRLPISIDELGVGKHPADPWGRPYRYWILAGRPVFISLGPDGKCGSDDIVSEDLRIGFDACSARDR